MNTVEELRMGGSLRAVRSAPGPKGEEAEGERKGKRQADGEGEGEGQGEERESGCPSQKGWALARELTDSQCARHLGTTLISSRLLRGNVRPVGGGGCRSGSSHPTRPFLSQKDCWA